MPILKVFSKCSSGSHQLIRPKYCFDSIGPSSVWWVMEISTFVSGGIFLGRETMTPRLLESTTMPQTSAPPLIGLMVALVKMSLTRDLPCRRFSLNFSSTFTPSSDGIYHKVVIWLMNKSFPVK